jgi:xanthine dehydrogenase small subunit
MFFATRWFTFHDAPSPASGPHHPTRHATAMTTQQPVRFFFRGQVHEVRDAHPTRTVLEWLREDARCTGTKEGCNEGDCGACTVAVGELAPGAAADGLALATVNACIRFLPTLNGKALFTVEDLKAIPAAGSTGCGGLHPAQQALVDCHGSQCGFCTPGFTMSLWNVYEHHQAHGTRPSRQQLAHDLSGNLCRCTGYRPILDAGEQMFDLPACRLDTTPAVAALQALRQQAENPSGEGFHCSAPHPGDAAGGRRDHFFAPTTLQALAALCEARPTARLLAGSTDIGLWVNKQFRDVGDLIYVGNMEALKAIETRPPDGDGGVTLHIGAAASLEAAWAALADRVPSLTEVWLRFASPPIRHAGTLGGNVANGSPIGDAPPVLMALDAEVELRRGEHVRRIPLCDFYVGYMKNQLQAGEFLQGIVVPLRAMEERQVRAYKVSKRFDSDISALCAGLSLRLDGEVVAEVRLAFGGMAGTVKRAAQAEDALLGRAWTQPAVDDAKAALALDFQPLSDLRAGSSYRMQVAQNLLQRFWLETRADDPMPRDAVQVWSGVLPAQPLAPSSAPAASGSAP